MGNGVSAFFGLLQRDLRLAVRRRGELANPLVFFVIVVSLFPLALGADPDVLRRIAPGVIWVAALLASLISMDSVFRADFEDGSLEQMLLSVYPAALLVAAKVLAHWLVAGLPLLLLAPVLGILLNLSPDVLPVLLLSLLLGTPVLSLVGAIGVALTVGLGRGGVLLSVLLLPLYVPVLVFGAGAVGAALEGLSAAPQLYILGALFALAASLAPFATAAALRVSLG
ncbi:MAG: heme exporter protein CcmB [Pseudomonadota bacterium]|nr:heme exporter protein CcmB [Pseudomonadota bacterium]